MRRTRSCWMPATLAQRTTPTIKTRASIRKLTVRMTELATGSGTSSLPDAPRQKELDSRVESESSSFGSGSGMASRTAAHTGVSVITFLPKLSKTPPYSKLTVVSEESRFTCDFCQVPASGARTSPRTGSVSDRRVNPVEGCSILEPHREPVAHSVESIALGKTCGFPAFHNDVTSQRCCNGNWHEWLRGDARNAGRCRRRIHIR